EGGPRQTNLVVGKLHSGHGPADRTRGAGKPQGRVAVRGADFEHPAGQRRLDQDRQELAGVPADVEHPPWPLARRSIVPLSELLELDQQRVQWLGHTSSWATTWKPNTGDGRCDCLRRHLRGTVAARDSHRRARAYGSRSTRPCASTASKRSR